MPKIIELTVEIDVERVSCPGVWLCQDARVSLTVFALGTSYQTCLLPPLFPLIFKDIFYFRKRFQETCALNNICCLLKDETIYCELVQWSEDCSTEECTILAQYLGALNDVLFPPNMCSNEGVDLLMRRSKEFPGILSPKIEIATKVRIDEVWNSSTVTSSPQPKATCHCSQRDADATRQRQVCHTPQYHRNKCNSANKRPTSTSRSRSRSGGSQSCCSLKDPGIHTNYKCHSPPSLLSPHCRTRSRTPSRHRPCSRSGLRTSPRAWSRPCPRYNICNIETGNVRWKESDGGAGGGANHSSHVSRSPRRSPRRRPYRQYSVYNVQVNAEDAAWTGNRQSDSLDYGEDTRSSDTDKEYSPTEERLQKILLESRFIEEEIEQKKRSHEKFKKVYRPKIHPCVCEICKRYHECFHTDCSKS